MDKLNVCKEYIWQLCNIESLNVDGFFAVYGLEQSRIEIHNKLCDLFKIDREKSKDILSHLEKIKIDTTTFPSDEDLEKYANRLVEYIENHIAELI